MRLIDLDDDRNCFCGNDGEYEKWNIDPDVLKDAITIEPEQRWIPVSERLPKDYEDVLIWFEYFRYGSYNRLYQMHGIGYYSNKYDSWMINHESGWDKLRVFAWMPLPEAYKGGEEYGN